MQKVLLLGQFLPSAKSVQIAYEALIPSLLLFSLNLQKLYYGD